MLCTFPPFLSYEEDWEDENKLLNCPFWVLFNQDTEDLRRQINSGVIKFPEFSWAGISAEAKDFLTGMLR